MPNPWNKKNPLMSMWLSSANRVAGAVRGQALFQMKKSAVQASKKAVSEATDTWLKPFAGATQSTKKRRGGQPPSMAGCNPGVSSCPRK